jgi:hypothetical protein
MPSFIKLETKIDNGIINRGKYTLPNTLALAINVLDVLVKQSEKYVHNVIPAR